MRSTARLLLRVPKGAPGADKKIYFPRVQRFIYDHQYRRDNACEFCSPPHLSSFSPPAKVMIITFVFATLAAICTVAVFPKGRLEKYSDFFVLNLHRNLSFAEELQRASPLLQDREKLTPAGLPVWSSPWQERPKDT